MRKPRPREVEELVQGHTASIGKSPEYPRALRLQSPGVECWMNKWCPRGSPHCGLRSFGPEASGLWGPCGFWRNPGPVYTEYIWPWARSVTEAPTVRSFSAQKAWDLLGAFCSDRRSPLACVSPPPAGRRGSRRGGALRSFLAAFLAAPAP